MPTPAPGTRGRGSCAMAHSPHPTTSARSRSPESTWPFTPPQSIWVSLFLASSALPHTSFLLSHLLLFWSPRYFFSALPATSFLVIFSPRYFFGEVGMGELFPRCIRPPSPMRLFLFVSVSPMPHAVPGHRTPHLPIHASFSCYFPPASTSPQPPFIMFAAAWPHPPGKRVLSYPDDTPNLLSPPPQAGNLTPPTSGPLTPTARPGRREL